MIGFDAGIHTCLIHLNTRDIHSGGKEINARALIMVYKFNMIGYKVQTLCTIYRVILVGWEGCPRGDNIPAALLR